MFDNIQIKPTGTISIHALTRRATERHRDSRNNRRISIHALTRRATFEMLKTIHDECISIHALTRRATIVLMGAPKEYPHFNPRPHEEGDCRLSAGVLDLRYFNPRPHEEGDHATIARYVFTVGFQSTPSRGGRPRHLNED